LGINELHNLLKKREITSKEITESFLEKINELNKEINSFITVCDDIALKQAEEADKKIDSGEFSELTGIPLGIKDLICTSGIKTTCGSKILHNYIPTYNATVYERLLEQSIVTLGKNNMDEFAMGSSNETSHFGPVKNPNSLDRVPGGSSGGSAAAVASNQCAASLGSDTGGSIRQPASFCGVVGLKPTYGRVSRYGLIAFASSLDQIGPITKNVEDAAILLKAISGYDNRDSTSVNIEVPDYLSNLKKECLKGLKIGVPKEYFIEGINKEVKNCVENKLKELGKNGAEIIEISLPHTEYAVAVYYIIAPAEASSNLARFDGVKYGYRTENYDNLLDMYKKTRAEGFGDEVKRRIMLGTYALSSGYYDAYYLKASKVRNLIKQDFAEAFKNVDVIVCPVTPTTAFKIGEKVDNPLEMYLNDIFTIPLNLAGTCGISIPIGKDSDNLPIGLQIIGNFFEEEKILNVAYNIEQL
jgi:aspartyl-tRNA(Asn)/glutamyl-tRNA(Gln) amidotransferase subunit A